MINQWMEHSATHPALLTRMSTLPYAATAASKSPVTSAAFDTSPLTRMALPPAAVISLTTALPACTTNKSFELLNEEQ